jgi:hypothetical protein
LQSRAIDKELTAGDEEELRDHAVATISLQNQRARVRCGRAGDFIATF